MATIQCPWCDSKDLDLKKRECRSCKTGLPHGSSLIRTNVGGLRRDIGSRRRQTYRPPLFHSGGQGMGRHPDQVQEDL